MRVLVCGSRDWNDIQSVHSVLTAISMKHGKLTVIDGGARGADDAGYAEARANGRDTLRFPADWKKHGPAAGHIRNQRMLDEGKPDLVLAFWDGVSRGTRDMIERARKAGVEVRIILADAIR